jgi:AsmA family protein
LHGRDAQVTFRAIQVDVGRLPFQTVSVRATIDDGVLTVAPLLAEVFGGHVNAHLKLDGRKKVPAANVDIRITDLHLGQLPHKDSGQAPMDGLMRARVLVSGVGSSIHQIAASANGTVRAEVPRGAIRESLAELTGIDLRGLGLLLAKNKREIPVRCAIASFKAQQGTLIAQSLVVDTDPVLIEGEGQVHFDSEALDLGIRGHPKSLRLFRLRAPILVQGTLGHPSVKIQGSKSVLVVVDPGRAKDADCTALLAAD